MRQKLYISVVYLRFTTGGKIRKTTGHIDHKNVYLSYINSRTAGKITIKGGYFRHLSAFKQTLAPTFFQILKSI